MIKLYNQIKRDQWGEFEYSMPIIARFGTGGGNTPIVLAADTSEDNMEDWIMATGQANAEIVRGGCSTLNTTDEHPILFSIDASEEGGDAVKSVVRRLTPLE